MIQFERSGILFILSAPSGAGKTTIASRLLAELTDLHLSVSCTTRRPRGGETDGRDYRFVSRDEFDAMLSRGEFAEWAEVHGHRYGTPRGPTERAVREGWDMLLDIDVQGGLQMKRRYPDAVSIFLFPPSVETLRARLRKRGTDPEEVIERRVRGAEKEVRQYRSHLYDYAVVNVDLEESVQLVLSILRAERVRVSRLRERGLS